jgi:hypothetical protein
MGWRFIFVLKNPPTVLRLLEIVQRFVDRLKWNMGSSDLYEKLTHLRVKNYVS